MKTLLLSMLATASVFAQGDGTVDNPYVVTSTSGQVSSGSPLFTATQDQYVSVNITGSYLYKNPAEINANLVVTNFVLVNGWSANVYTVNGAVSGGSEAVMGINIDNNVNLGTLTFNVSGDVSAYQGEISIIDTTPDKTSVHTLTLNGGGVINAAVVTNTTGYMNIGSTVATTVNSDVTAKDLTLTGENTFTKSLTSTTTTLESGASLTISGEASLGELTLDLSEGMILDLSSGVTIDSLILTGLAEGESVELDLRGNAYNLLKDKLNDAGYGILDNGNGTYTVGMDVVPEPTTATLSLLALAGLCARRRRK